MSGILGIGEQPYIPGLSDFQVAEANAQRGQAHQLSQALGILRMKDILAQQQENAYAAPLRRRLLEAQVSGAEHPAPILKDLGGAIGIFDPKTYQQIGTLPKTATPDAMLKEGGANARHAVPSGSAQLNANVDMYKFNNVSPYQERQLGMEAGRLFNQGTETQFNTGRGTTRALPQGAGAGSVVWQIPPAVQAQRDADASRIITAENNGGAGMIPTPNVVQPAGNPSMTPKDRAKLEASRPAETAGAKGLMLQLDNTLFQIDKLDKSPGLSNITGPVMGRTPNISGDATNSQAYLDTLKSQIGVQVLQAMREASKTGGAVGNVTEKEWPILQNQLAALQQSQTTDQFRTNLGVVRTTIRNMRGNALKAFEDNYGKLDYRTPNFGRRSTDSAPDSSDDPLRLRR